MTDIFFEDLRPGAVTTFGDMLVGREAIVAFAREFDPQPFHVDEKAARDTFVGRLIASGWHTAALQMRMSFDAWIGRAASQGAPGVERLEWLRPVLPGDRLSVRQTILDTKGSRSRPELGLVLFQFETLNGAGETVMRQTNWSMLGRRAPAHPGGHDSDATRTDTSSAPTAAPGPPPDAGSSHFERAFDDVDIGATEHLGSYAFTADTIVRYAREFDPQPFHLDEAFARTTHFGGLAASGWHTAAAWMSLLVGRRQAAIAAVAARGGEKPRFGPSPGLTELRWRRPVLAGDTLLCATTVVDKRASASRPEWGIVSNHNGAWNQRGELVFEFKASNFWGRRAR